MIADLYFRIAKSYTHIPDLRIGWLEKLGHFHDKQQDFVEAGHCYIQVAALIWNFLLGTQADAYRELEHVISPVFAQLAPGTGGHIDWSAMEEVSSSPHFCEKGMIAALKKAIYFLKQAEFFEFANELYKVLTPLYERSDSYKDLSQAHQQLNQFFQTLWSQSETRLLGRYFRVGFFGSQFAELDGKEFVYREKHLTHLLDITERLKVRVRSPTLSHTC